MPPTYDLDRLADDGGPHTADHEPADQTCPGCGRWGCVLCYWGAEGHQ